MAQTFDLQGKRYAAYRTGHTEQGIPYATDIAVMIHILHILNQDSLYTSSIDQMIWPTHFKDKHLLVFWFISVKFKTHGSRKLILSFSWNNFQISRFDWWIELYQAAIAKWLITDPRIEVKNLLYTFASIIGCHVLPFCMLFIKLPFLFVRWMLNIELSYPATLTLK